MFLCLGELGIGLRLESKQRFNGDFVTLNIGPSGPLPFRVVKYVGNK